MSADASAPSSALTSVSKALKLLGMLQHHESLRVVDVSRSLGVAGSTAHRLLTCLRDEGFLRQKSASRRYVAGPELLRLARHFSDQNTLEHVAHPHLERLCKSVNEAVNLQILVGSEVLCIDSVVEDRHTLQVHHITGQRVVATVSAAGKLLLSSLPPDRLTEVTQEVAGTTGAPTERQRADLHRELATIRERGYAVNMGDREPGVHAVAVPIYDLERTMIAAVSVAAPSVRLPAHRVAGLVKTLRIASLAITADYFATTDD